MKGSVVGISASETANNAVTGSSLIPLLTLGIPGSATAAILLGALVIHGLLPGRTLFTDHANITYTVIFGFFLANLVMGVIGMGLGRYMSYITRLSNYVLIPMIIAYSLGNNFFDVYTMLGFGILGYFMRKIGFPPAPLILGLILGPIAETGFRQSVILAKGSVIGHILSSPISLVLFAATLLSIASAAWLEYRKLRSLREQADAAGAEPGE
jgi:putative tricarboxylic transport membrane protein